MRSIRNAAVAGVTALAVSLSGVQAFAAEETPATETETSTTTTTAAPTEDTNEGKTEEPSKDNEGSSDKAGDETKTGSLSSKYSKEYEGEKAVTGQDAFGSSKLSKDKLPKWFNAWEGFTIAGIVLTVFTNLIAPAYNYLKYNGII
ncbi:hypothetical protein [Corynebacterium glucuronolyticum]|uniref:Or membrane protein n=2 Tax=Corynebacterium glucuronolyticum TaxID=39791 RepID=A0AAX1L8U4_9CORY|nr:hypothetical protein [Corynebacterium glucuronolyticum]EEI64029.1 hypothetical protein HMPREF0293_0474 [Corynebacterium glucuronolyticum ATCC 51866]QRP70819.1 hypothetical protein I6J21_01185 [Corynebacterium glucuronolyticum]